jgi:hypothetical protein
VVNHVDHSRIVIRNYVVVEPVTPQDFIWQVGRPYLDEISKHLEQYTYRKTLNLHNLYSINRFNFCVHIVSKSIHKFLFSSLIAALWFQAHAKINTNSYLRRR